MSPLRWLLRLFGFVKVREYGYMLTGEGHLVPLPEVARPGLESGGWQLPQAPAAELAVPRFAVPPPGPAGLAAPGQASDAEDDAEEWEWRMAMARAREQAEADERAAARRVVTTPTPRPDLEAVIRAATTVEPPPSGERAAVIARTFAAIMPAGAVDGRAPRPDATPASVTQPTEAADVPPSGLEEAAPAEPGAPPPAGARGTTSTPIARRPAPAAIVTRVMSSEPGGTLSNLRARSGGKPVEHPARRARPSTRSTASALTRPSVLMPRDKLGMEPPRSARGTVAPTASRATTDDGWGEARDGGEITRVAILDEIDRGATSAVTRVASLEEIQRAARASAEPHPVSGPAFEDSAPTTMIMESPALAGERAVAAAPRTAPAAVPVFEASAPPTIVMMRPEPETRPAITPGPAFEASAPPTIVMMRPAPQPRPVSAGPAFEASAPATLIMPGDDANHAIDAPTVIEEALPERKPAPLPRLTDRRRR